VAGGACRDAAETQRHAQQFAVVQFDLFHVFQQRPASAIDRDGIDKRGEQGLLRTRGEHHFLHHPPHRLAGCTAALFGGTGFRHGDARGGQDAQGDARQELLRIASGSAREPGARRTVQTHRQNLRAGLGRDEGRAVVHLHQTAGGGDAAFREDHHRAAGFQQFDDALHRHRIGRIDRQVIDQRQHQPE
jgi:hypothetical protein